MKKSDALHLAQIAVVNSANISPNNKVEIMKYLIDDERFALFCENKEEQEVHNNERII